MRAPASLAALLLAAACTNTFAARSQKTAAFPLTWDEVGAERRDAPPARDASAAVQERAQHSDAERERAARAASGAAVPASAKNRRIPTKGKLAVLDLKRYASEIGENDVRYFTDLVRGATLRAASTLDVMTRENLLVLLQATGKSLENCEGECEVDTGRRIGADLIISGDVLKVGSRFKVSLKLHDTHEGRLLSTVVANGKSIEELDDGLQKAAAELFEAR